MSIEIKSISAIYILNFVLVLCSCTNVDKDDYAVTNVFDKKQTNLSEIFSKIEYIGLSGSRFGDISLVDKILVTEFGIYAIDFNESRSIGIFDSEGNHIRTISKIGRGPGEYLSIYDIIVNKDKSIEILDHLNKIIKYDSIGNFLSDRELPFHASKFTKLLENRYIFFTPETATMEGLGCEFMLGAFNEDGYLLTECLLETQIQNPFIMERMIFSGKENNILFGRSLNNSIYSFKNGSSQKILEIQYGSLTPSNNSLIERVSSGKINPDDFFQEVRQNGIPYHSSYLVSNKSLLISKINTPDLRFYFFYDLGTRNLVGSGPIINDLDDGPNNFTIVSSYKDYIIAMVPPIGIEGWLELNSNRTNHPFFHHAKQAEKDGFKLPILVFLRVNEKFNY